MKKKKVFEAAAAVLSCAALAVMLAGCGQSSSTSASSSQASSSSPAGGSSGKSKSSSPAPSASSSASPSGSQSASSSSSSSSQSGESGSASQSQETGSAPQNSTSGSAPQSTSGTSSSASLTHYSQDPSVPLPKAISPSIPDSATVIGPDYAQLPNGKVVNLSNGQEVTNPKIVGTATTPPDPGAASGGMNFIPEQVGSVRSQMKKLQESQEGSAGTSAYVVKTAAYIPNGNYGAFWSSNSNGEAFYDGQGNLFVQQAKGVIDVSAWNGDVNWAELKNEGVQGAIIRLDYGSYNGYDSEALNNIDQCLKLGIPIGVYVYSYAYNSQVAYGEGSYAATLLKQAGLSPSQLPLGIYYDLEAYSWYAHPHPTSPQVYQGIVSSFFDALSADGYTNASVYSYPEYLETELNNSYIYQHVGWIASYSWVPGFNQWNTNFRGWQYSDEGEMAGTNGYVDLDAFGYASYSPIAWTGSLNLSSYPIADLPDGDYYIDLASDLSNSLQAPSGQEGIQMNAAAGDRSQGQIWYLHRNPNGSYGILNTLGNYWLDVWQGNMTPGNKIDQWDGNGLPTQQWFIRKVNNAYILQPELGNICLGVENGEAQVQEPSGSSSQLFRLSAVNNSIPLNTPVVITSNGEALSDPDFSRDNLVQLAVSPFTGANNQLWEISEKADGLYQLKNVYSGLLMDDLYGGTDPGNIVDQDASNGLNPQLWLLQSPSEISFVSAVSTNLMTATDGKTALQVPGTAGQDWQAETYHPFNLSSYPTADLPDGDYYIDLASDLSTSLQAPSSQEGIQMNSANGNRSQGQIWYLHRNPNGSYGILNTLGNYWLDVWQGNMTPGNKIDQWIGNGTEAQQWFIRKVNNAYILQPELGNICLGVENGEAQVQEPSGSSSQLFRLSAVNNSIPLNTPVSITQGNSAMQSPGSGQLAQLTTSPLTYSPSQKWEISESGDGVYSIKSLSSEFMVDDQYAQTNPGTIVDQYPSNGTGSQMWLLTTPNGISFTSSNGYGVITASSSGLTLQNYGQGSQNWDVKAFVTPLNLSSYPAADLPDGDYYIDLASDLSTSLQAPSGQEGIQMNAAAGDRSQGQIWYLHRNPNGSYGILNTLGNYWLDVWQANQTPGNKIDQWIGNGTEAQQWFIRKVNNAYILQPELGNICLGAENGEAQVQEPSGSSSQLFRLSAVNNSIPLNTPVVITQNNQAIQSPGSNPLAQLSTSAIAYSSNQKWEISETADGLYSIKSLSSEMMVDDQYAQTEPGTIVDQYPSNGTNSQIWLLSSPESISFTSANSNEVITSSSSGLTLQNSGQNSQDWKVLKFASTLNLSSYPIADLPDGDYYIDLASDLSTSLQAPSSQEGIQMNSANGNRSQGQIWYLHRNPNGSYGILNTLGNYWLDVWQANQTPGNKIDQWIGNGTEAQQWFIRKVNNAYILQPELGNICLGVENGEAQVQIPTGSANQTVVLIRA